MKQKKKISPLWLIPAVVIVALILWCIYFPLTMFAGLDKDAELNLVGITVYDAETPLEITFSSEEAEMLIQLAAELRSTRSRFMGWYSYITYTDEPLLDVYLSGRDAHGLFTIRLSADDAGYIYIPREGVGGIRVRAKDSALYDYLTSLSLQGATKRTNIHPFRAMSLS